MTNDIGYPNLSAMVEQAESSTQCSSMLNLDHVWHPNNYGTQFTNGSLTIAINGLSIDKVWCDLHKVPPWAFKNFGVLLCDPHHFGPEPSYVEESPYAGSMTFHGSHTVTPIITCMDCNPLLSLESSPKNARLTSIP